jgi:hypothetical protein
MIQSKFNVYRRISSLAVAVLVLGTLLLGQCAACPLISQPAPSSAHDCCQPPDPGDCHGSKPAKKCSGETAVPESNVKADPAIPAAPAPAIAEAPAAPVVFEPVAITEGPPFAPDLYLRNSVLLI